MGRFLRSPCRQCLVKPCCSSRCNGKIKYDEAITIRRNRRFDLLRDVLGFSFAFGLIFSFVIGFIVGL